MPVPDIKVDDSKVVTPPAGGVPNGGEPGKDIFTDAQQTKVQDLIDDAYKRAYAKANKGSAEKIGGLEAELADAVKKSEGKGGEGTAAKDLTLLKEDHEKLKTRNTVLLKENTEARISKTLDGLDVYNRDQVISLVSGNVTQDESGKITINTPSGQFINKQGHEGTLKEYIDDFLSKNANLLKASDKKGSGSGKPEDNITPVSISKEDFNKKSDLEKREFLKSGGEIK